MDNRDKIFDIIDSFRTQDSTDEERKNLNSNYEKIIDADFSSKQKLINDYIDLYNQKTSKKL